MGGGAGFLSHMLEHHCKTDAKKGGCGRIHGRGNDLRKRFKPLGRESDHRLELRSLVIGPTLTAFPYDPQRSSHGYLPQSRASGCVNVGPLTWVTFATHHAREHAAARQNVILQGVDTSADASLAWSTGPAAEDCWLCKSRASTAKRFCSGGSNAPQIGLAETHILTVPCVQLCSGPDK